MEKIKKETKKGRRESKTEENKRENIGKEVCLDRRCPKHGTISTRGRKFKGHVKKIVGQRAVISVERIAYYAKYKRYIKKKSKLHAHIPKCMTETIKPGSYVLIEECKPLSKITHFVVLEVIK